MMEYIKRSLDRGIMQQILDNFTDLTGIRVAYFENMQEAVTGQEKSICAFCALIRKELGFNDACIESDRAAFDRAEKLKGVYLYKCHMGFWEAVVPIIVRKQYVGSLMLGQLVCAEENQKQWTQIERRLDAADIIPERKLVLRAAYEKMQHISRDKLKAAANMLEIIARYIIDTDVVYIYDMEAIEKAKVYISENYANEISTSSISKIVGLSSSYFSFLFKRETDKTVTEHINELRMEKAKELLAATTLSVKEIAAQTGFNDQNYFSRAFKKHTGQNPVAFRNKIKK